MRLKYYIDTRSKSDLKNNKINSDNSENSQPLSPKLLHQLQIKTFSGFKVDKKKKLNSSKELSEGLSEMTEKLIKITPRTRPGTTSQYVTLQTQKQMTDFKPMFNNLNVFTKRI